MIKVNPIISNFTSGELSKDMLGRADVERFFNGAEIIENFHCRASGGIYRRMGTERIAESECASPRLIDFTRSRSESYILQLGCGAIHVVSDEPAPVDPFAVTVTYTIADGGSPVERNFLSTGLDSVMAGFGWVSRTLDATSDGASATAVLWVHLNGSGDTPDAPDGYTVEFFADLYNTATSSFFDGWLLYETP
jgi:hypothetical protein